MELTKTYIFETLLSEHLWDVGQTAEFSFRHWDLTLRKEEEIYSPFQFAVTGKHKEFPTNTWGRRYTSMSDAFLHILNHFNENASIRNRYDSISEALFDSRSEIKT